MKITGIKPHVVGNSWKDWLLVRVDTDEESTAWAREP